MNTSFDLGTIRPLQQALRDHPVYESVACLESLRGFMEHHVYAVWDFMSVLKYLQHVIAPSAAPWMALGNAAVRRLINEIVLEEESDEGPPGPDGRPTYVSHFELYCQAMAEVGADPDPVMQFVARVRHHGIDAAVNAGIAPAAAARFTRTTFDLLETGKPHVVAAALSLGREDIIPGMFRALLARMRVSASQAPAFHYYLERHIHLDEGSHAPLAELMLEELCAGDPRRMREAEAAARTALEARLQFWDDVLDALRGKCLRRTGT